MRKYLLIPILLLTACIRLHAEAPDTIEIAFLMDNAQYQEVISLTTTAIESAPKSGVLYYYRANAYQSTDRMQDAIEDATMAITYPQDCNIEIDRLFTWRARMYLQQKDTVHALQDLSAAIRKRPDDAVHYVNRGDCYYATGRYRDAANDYLRAADLTPNNTTYRITYAHLLLLDGQTRAGCNELRDITRLNVHNTEAPLLLATTEFACGDYHSALEDYITFTDRTYHEQRHYVATDLYESCALHDYAYTYHTISDQIDHYNDTEEWGLRNYFYMVRAAIYIQKQYWQDALLDLDSVSTLAISEETDTLLLQRRAFCYFHTQQIDRAIACYDRLIRLAPNQANLYVMRGDCYFAMANWGKAEADLLYAYRNIDAQQQHTVARKLGFVYQHKQQAEQAVEWFTTSIETNPESDPIATFYRGRAYLQIGDTLSGEEDFEQVLEIDTTTLYSVRHYALLALERTEEALEWMNLILDTYPNSEDYYDAACLVSLIGDTDRALHHLEMALRLGWRNYQHILADTDLDPIRSDERYGLMMKRYFPNQF